MNATYHKEHLLDRAVMLAMRAFLALQPRMKFVPASRPDLDALIEKTDAAQGVAFQDAIIGGVAGWWCRPSSATPASAVLYLHGGGYVLGTANAFRNFCSQIAQRAGVAVFVVDYGLAPEHPFPQALNDAQTVYRELAKSGYPKLIVAGDSAGGGLALSLIQLLQTGSQPKPVGGVVFSPWTDVTLSGDSLKTKADLDPILSREGLEQAAQQYTGPHDRHDPEVSPLFGNFNGFPPVLIHVGEDEVLLDDARRVAARIEESGALAYLHVWQGMTHVFLSNLLLEASKEALEEVGLFIRQTCLAGAAAAR